MKKITLYIFIFLFLISAGEALAHQPRLVYLSSYGGSPEGRQEIQIENPELSQAFYDELKGAPRDYYIESDKDFNLYINLLVPGHANTAGRYSADVFLLDGNNKNKIASLDGSSAQWTEFWEEYGRDWYLKGPEFSQNVGAGKYKIEVFSVNNTDNFGKYVLAVGKTESYDLKALLNVYWQLPMLKLTFFKTSVLQFFLTPFGIGLIGFIGGLLVFLALIYWIVGLIKTAIKHAQAKTLLLASLGERMKEEIPQLLQKPAYDITVGFITTAYKYKLAEEPDYESSSYPILRDMGFNIEKIDIEGKREGEVMKLLELKDIIFVAGGNTFYLLKAMRECKFEKIIRKLLKRGIVYAGSSAGSIVVGKTVKPAYWLGDKNFVGLRNLKGLHLVPFDIFVHYQPEYNEIIKQKMPNPEKRAKNLKILTDEQAILVQGKEVDLIGEGEAIII